ncbi:hypothetical protein [Hydrogenobaculum acidophilum]
MSVKRILASFFFLGAIISSYGMVIPLKSDVKMENGAYGVTNYYKKVSKPLSFMYVGDSISKVGKKKEKYRVYISKGKGKFGDNVYRVWLSFVNENYFKNAVASIRKLSPEEAANEISPSSGMLSLAEVDYKANKITIVGMGPIKVNMVYKIDKNAPPINKKIYNLVCEKGKLPIIYIKQ